MIAEQKFGIESDRRGACPYRSNSFFLIEADLMFDVVLKRVLCMQAGRGIRGYHKILGLSL